MIAALLAAWLAQGDAEWEHWGAFTVGTTVVRKVTEQHGGGVPAERTVTFKITKWDGEVVDIEMSGDGIATETKRYTKPVKLPEQTMPDEEFSISGKKYVAKVREEGYYAGRARWTLIRATCSTAPVPGGVMRLSIAFRSDGSERKEAYEIVAIKENVKLTLDGTEHACVMYDETVTRVGVHEPRKRTQWYSKKADVPGGILRTKETYMQGDFQWAWTITSTPGDKAKVGEREVAIWKRVSQVEKTRPLVKGWKASEETVEKLSREVPGWLVSLDRTVKGDGGESYATEETVGFDPKKP